MQSIIRFFEHYMTGPWLVFVLSMLPLIELKGTIPVGLAMGMGLRKTFLLAYLGSGFPIPFIIIFIRDIFQWMHKNDRMRAWIEKLEEKTLKKAERHRALGLLGIFIFVAIPLPGTGVWTGSLLATLLGYRLKHALPTIWGGNLIAGLIITGLSYGLKNLLF